MTFGLTAAGFVKKTLLDIKEELENQYKVAFGNSIDLDPRLPVGQIIGINAEREALIWEMAEEIYNSQYPDTADDVSLDNVVAITGTKRNPATYSTGVITITGTPGTIVEAGFQVSVEGASDRIFETVSDVTIDVGGDVDANVIATRTGALTALADTLTVIVSALFGVDSVTNAEDIEAGENRETASELRLRRRQGLANAGSSTTEAIRSALLEVEGVEAVTVFENISIMDDVDGRPPKSFEALVKGGSDEDIGNAIWQNKPAGIETFGDEEYEITDSQGFAKVMKFSRPNIVDIYLELDLVTTSSYPEDGDDLVIEQVLAYGATLNLGDSVIVSPALISYLNNVPGITGVTVRIGKTVDPTLDDNIAIELDELAEFDSSRIEVSVS